MKRLWIATAALAALVAATPALAEYSWHHEQDPSVEKTKTCVGKITSNGGRERLVQNDNIKCVLPVSSWLR